MTRSELLLMVLCITLLWPGCGSAGQTPSPPPDRDKAQRLAIETLSDKLAIDADQIEVVYVSAMNWPDSSLGCPQPGVDYLQVVTPGSLVLLRAGTNAYRVHVGNTRAIICDRPGSPGPGLGQHRPAGTAVQELMQKAKADLARRLGVNPGEVAIGMIESVAWPNSALGCPVAGITPDESEVAGFRVTLNYAGQDYRYHTDDQRVIPCPPIENQ